MWEREGTEERGKRVFWWIEGCAVAASSGGVKIAPQTTGGSLCWQFYTSTECTAFLR